MKQLKHPPYLICVTGLKNSGKTTVCTALIEELSARGFTVGALKSSHVSRLTLDHRSGDSYALAESGAYFVLVQGPQESLILERRGRSFRQMLERVPAGVDFLVSEGGRSRAAGSVIVCLGDASDWNETLRVRGIPGDRILAVSGSFLRGGGGESFEGFPVYDARREDDRRALADRILESADRRPG